VAAEKQQFIDDQRQRNAVEGKIGQGKRRFGLDLIREKLPATQGSTIALNVLVMTSISCWSFFLSFVDPGSTLSSAIKEAKSRDWCV
jgi:hypothetical protein